MPIQEDARMHLNHGIRIILRLALLIPLGMLFLLSCSEGSRDTDLRYQPPKGEAGIKHEEGISVHTVYVPVYSHVYFGDGRPYLLATTLSIRNTDLKRGITVKSVKYYDTDGKLVRNYLADPLRLRALASKEILVEEHDIAGGSGAKFIVEWTSEEAVERPIIEAVMIGASDLRGISFVTTGKEVSGH
jgi:hypothetical protein